MSKGSLAASLLVALLIHADTGAAASSSLAVADISFSRGDLRGNVTLDSSGAYLLQTAIGAGSFVWQLNAANVTVRLAAQTFLEVGKPTNLSQPLGRVATEPKSETKEQFNHSILNSTSRSAVSNIVVRPLGWQLPNLGEGTGRFLLTPYAPEHANNTTPDGRPSEIPTNATWGTQRGNRVVLTGNFSVSVYDGVVTLHNMTTNRTFHSGNWTTGIGPAPPGQPHPVRERHEQSVRIDVRNGVLELRPSGREVSFASPKITVAANMTAAFRDVNGQVRYAGDKMPLKEALWSVNGIARLEVWNPSANGSLLQGRLTAPPQVFGFADAPRPPDPGATRLASPQRFSWPMFLTTLPATLILSAVGWAGYRRTRPPTIDDVEVALFRRQPKRAASLARRLVKRNPRDATVLFLLATALALTGRHRSVLREVEPHAIKLAPRKRAGIAFVLAVAANRAGQHAKSLRWAAEAAREPPLHAQLVAANLWLQPPNPTPTQTGYA